MVDLTDSTVATLCDTEDAWPDQLRLDGFTYRRIESNVAVSERRRWLARHVKFESEREFAPRTYEQLSSTLRATGDEGAARTVAVARPRAHRELLPWRGSRWLRRAWSGFLDTTVGFGYRPWQALIWLVVAWGGLWLLIDHAQGPTPCGRSPPSNRSSPPGR